MVCVEMSQRIAGATQRLQADLVLAGRQFQPQHLDLVRQQAPATRIGRFGGFPGDADEIEQDIRPRSTFQLPRPLCRRR